MESMSSHYAGKVRHAEFWLTQLINTFGRGAGRSALDEATLKAARAKHTEAHANWEWWTASNGSAFHNLDQAKESLAKSASASQEGIKILRDARGSASARRLRRHRSSACRVSIARSGKVSRVSSRGGAGRRQLRPFLFRPRSRRAPATPDNPRP